MDNDKNMGMDMDMDSGKSVPKSSGMRSLVSSLYKKNVP
jgi:hypothetical protein